MAAVGLGAIPGPSQAARFIINLDNARYGAYKADVANWAKNGIMAYPQTLEAAFESASTHREAHTAPSALSGSAYATHGRSTGKGAGRGRGRGRGRGHEDKHSSTDSTDTSPKCTKPCPICSEMHWKRYCPLVIAAKEKHDKDSKSKQSKDKSDKVHITFSRAVACFFFFLVFRPLRYRLEVKKI